MGAIQKLGSRMGLVLSRRQYEEIEIFDRNGADVDGGAVQPIRITLVSPGRSQIAIDAPDNYTILRSEAKSREG
jgi:sRNA-binding carbon storage regulator CsrA